MTYIYKFYFILKDYTKYYPKTIYKDISNYVTT